MHNTILQRQRVKSKVISKCKLINLEKIKYGRESKVPQPLWKHLPAPAPYFLHPLFKIFQIPLSLGVGGN